MMFELAHKRINLPVVRGKSAPEFEHWIRRVAQERVWSLVDLLDSYMEVVHGQITEIDDKRTPQTIFFGCLVSLILKFHIYSPRCGLRWFWCIRGTKTQVHGWVSINEICPRSNLDRGLVWTVLSGRMVWIGWLRTLASFGWRSFVLAFVNVDMLA